MTESNERKGPRVTRRTALWSLPILATGGTVWMLVRGSKLPVYKYKIENTFDHDKAAFTQGLLFAKGALYESTGRRKFSRLRKVELKTGEVLQEHKLDDAIFAEGLALWDEWLIQLTYTSRQAIYYDFETFAEIRRAEYRGEGWGLTHDGTNLIMSNGTSTLSFHDPKTFEKARELKVLDDRGRVVPYLNELEFIKGEIWANIWGEEIVARIDPNSGNVTAWVDFKGLKPDDAGKEDVLNGIAYDDENDRYFVTGKLWPKLFEVSLVEPDAKT